MMYRNQAEAQDAVTCRRFTTRVTGTHTGTLKFNRKEYKATGKVVQVRRLWVHCDVPRLWSQAHRAQCLMMPAGTTYMHDDKCHPVINLIRSIHHRARQSA